MNKLQRIALAAATLTLSFNLTAAEEAPKAAERAPKGAEKAKQIQKYDVDGDAKLDAGSQFLNGRLLALRRIFRADEA